MRPPDFGFDKRGGVISGGDKTFCCCCGCGGDKMGPCGGVDKGGERGVAGRVWIGTAAVGGGGVDGRG